MSTNAPCAGCGHARRVGQRTLIVSTAADLRPLLWSWKRYDDLRVSATDLDAEQRIAWEDRLLRLYGDCGCETGAVAVLVVVVALFVLFGEGVRPASAVTATVVALALLMAGALVGKTIGVASARVRLRRAVSGFSRDLGAVAEPGRPPT